MALIPIKEKTLIENMKVLFLLLIFITVKTFIDTNVYNLNTWLHRERGRD